MNTVSSIEDLKIWFDDQPHIYWTMYRGHLEKKEGSRMVVRNESKTNREDSWEMLQQQIRIHSGTGGKFTILTTPAARGNAGNTTFLTIKNPYARSSAISGTPDPVGIYGTGVRQVIDEAKATENKMVNLQRDVEDLQYDLEAKNQSPSAIGKIIDMATTDPQGFATAAMGVAQSVSVLLGAVRGMVQPQAATNTAAVNGSPAYDTDSSFDESIETLGKHFDVKEMLSAMAAFAEANPEQAKMIFQNLTGHAPD